MAGEKKINMPKYLITLFIGLFLMFVLWRIVPTWATLTTQGVAALCIFVAMIWFIATGFDLITSGLLGLLAIVVAKGYTYSGLISATFGGTTIFNMCMIYPLCEMLSETGASTWLAKWLVTRKFAQGKPMAFTALFLFACMAMGAFGGSIILIYGILDGIKKTVGYDNDSQFAKVMSLTAFTSNTIGTTILPFKGMPLIIFSPVVAAMANYGMELNNGIYIVVCAIVAVVVVCVTLVLIKFVWKTDMSKLSSLDLTKNPDMAAGKPTTPQTYSLIAFSLAIIYNLLLCFKNAFYYPFLNSLGSGIVFGSLFAIVSLLTYKHERVLPNTEKTYRNGARWSIIVTVTAFTACGNMISSNDFGVKAWLQQLLGPAFSGAGFWGFMAIVAILSVLVTNFFSNTALGMIIGTICTPFIAQFAESDGINPTVAVSLIVVGCMWAFLTMSASGNSPFFLCRDEIAHDMKFVWTKGLTLAIVGMVIFWAMFSAFSFVF